MNAEVGVVAVVVVVHVSGDRFAVLPGNRRVAEAVAVGIQVVGHRQALVDGAVAVVVDTVTDLDRAGIAGRTAVVAVIGRRDIPRHDVAGSHARSGVPVAVTIGVGVVGRHWQPLVDGAVAVVVDTVAEFGSPRIDGGVGVVAITVGHGHAVAIAISGNADRAAAHGVARKRDRAHGAVVDLDPIGAGLVFDAHGVGVAVVGIVEVVDIDVVGPFVEHDLGRDVAAAAVVDHVVELDGESSARRRALGEIVDAAAAAGVEVFPGKGHKPIRRGRRRNRRAGAAPVIGCGREGYEAVG